MIRVIDDPVLDGNVAAIDENGERLQSSHDPADVEYLEKLLND